MIREEMMVMAMMLPRLIPSSSLHCTAVPLYMLRATAAGSNIHLRLTGLQTPSDRHSDKARSAVMRV